MKGRKGLLIAAVAVVLLAVAVLGVLFLRPKKTVNCNVTFQDFDGTVLNTQVVSYGEGAIAPEEPKREGYTFSGWDKDFSAVTKDVVITAIYTHITETVFTVESVSESRGEDNVQVKVSVTNNPGILGMMFAVNYDESVLTLVDCQNGAALSALTFQQPSRYASGCNFVWYGSETGEVTDGEMLILTFSVAEGAAPGNYPITISFSDQDIFDSNCDIVSPDIVQGGIVISD